MTVQEEKTFIEDPKPNMTREEKNKYLGYKLREIPYCTQNIMRIERVEIGGAGWVIHYRTASRD